VQLDKERAALRAINDEILYHSEEFEPDEILRLRSLTENGDREAKAVYDAAMTRFQQARMATGVIVPRAQLLEQLKTDHMVRIQELESLLLARREAEQAVTLTGHVGEKNSPIGLVCLLWVFLFPLCCVARCYTHNHARATRILVPETMW
jgi:hypothetical protein